MNVRLRPESYRRIFAVTLRSTMASMRSTLLFSGGVWVRTQPPTSIVRREVAAIDLRLLARLFSYFDHPKINVASKRPYKQIYLRVA